ncbi:MAG: YkgJ family cysteine cluster protein [Deltaproteobacteria bacterium]|nr:YkgJ family cysteine cluster protein [Deltaproteobacteria bacterium]
MVDPKAESPASWDAQTFAARWRERLEILTDEAGPELTFKRVKYQAEQSPLYQQASSGWSELSGEQRDDIWMRLLDDSARSAAEPQPVCVRCGECCRLGSPTLESDDLELLSEERIPWSELYTMRVGEPARSPHTDQPFFLEAERIKIRETPGSNECVFLDAETCLCRIHADRPLQCRAQACWEDVDGQRFIDAEYLTRQHLFAAVEPLLEVLGKHDTRCSFERLRDSFETLKESGGHNADEAIDVLAFDEHTREFCVQQLSVPEAALDLLLGRSLSSRLKLFGFRVETAADGTRTLTPEN